MTSTIKKPPLVIGFVGENSNGSLETATRYINGILSFYGIETHCINLLDPDWINLLRALVSDRTPHFCYGFGGIGAGLKNGRNSFWTDYKTPFLSFMYDHPFCNPGQHQVNSPYVANCYFIADFLEVQLQYIKHPHHCFLMRDPVVAPPPVPRLSKEEYQSRWRQRRIPYLFIKNGSDPAKLIPSIQALGLIEQTIFWDCLALLHYSADYNLTHLVAQYCRAQQIEAHAGNENFTGIVRLLECYVRDWRSRQIVEWLKNKPAIIIGAGWESIDKTGAVAQFLPPMPATQCWDMYRDSRFVVNANPCFRDGCHERVLGGLQAGAVTISDRNRFSDHVFADLENFVSFDWGDRNWQSTLDARVAAIEANGGDFNPDLSRQKLAMQFPQEPFVTGLLTAAQKIRDAAA